MMKRRKMSKKKTLKKNIFKITSILLIANLVVGGFFVAPNVLADSTGTLQTVVNGHYTSWTGGESDIDETSSFSCAESDSIRESTTGDRESFTLSLSSIPNGKTITSVSVTVRDRGHSSAGGTYKTFARLNGTDTDASAELSATGGSSDPCSSTKTQTLDVTDTVKSAGTTLEIGVVKTSGNANTVRVGTMTATVTYITPDTTAPVITLIGSTPVTVAVGDSYSDAGATASDDVDGDITASIVTVNPVNAAVVGPYTVTYDVADAAGNAATQVTRMVNVTDTISPVVTLTGANPQILEVGSVYSELGATVFDNYDTGLVATINSSAINMSVVGSYTVTYDVVDSSGNNATQVTRTVDVVDTTAPVITLNGSNPFTHLVNTSYSDDGSIATDNYDGDLTSSITTTNNVEDTVVGSYSVTYDVVDANGNVALQVVRTVNVVDTTAPVINLEGANPQTIEVGGEYSELGATVFDDYDTELSATIDSSAVNTSVVDSYSVTYNAVDSNENVAETATRTVNVVDTTAPVITLTGFSTVTVAVGDAYIDDGATAVDNYDGDITENIEIFNPVNTAVVGAYTVTYDVTDESDNETEQVTRTVNVVDTTAPVITLDGANPQVVEIGTAYSELGATVADNYNTGLVATINSFAVNTAAIGSYTVTYNAVDTNGNNATEVTRTVNVVDTTAPVITVASYITTPTNADITVGVSVNEGSLNTSSHLFTANGSFDFVATDASGNVATQTVNITNIDKIAPVITRLSFSPFQLTTGDSYTDPGATAIDNADGEITLSIVTVNPVNTSTAGTYTVTYNVTDAAGNAGEQKTRTVIVTKPVVTGPSGGGEPSILSSVVITPISIPSASTINTAVISPPAGSVLAEKITLLDTLIATLRPYKRNSKVKQLQQELKKLGLFNLPYFTDYWGPITNTGVKKYLSTK